MKVYINKITGLDDAMVSLLMSKRSWTPEKDSEIREMVQRNTDYRTGRAIGGVNTGYPEFIKWMDKLIKYGVQEGHTTLLRFIDISITVEGLHRAGQDDWDAHAARMDNRIVRASTRLGDFKEGEISDYYKDKILYPFQALEYAGITIPKQVEVDGVNFIKTDFGYVRTDLYQDRDAKRGLYPEAIPSTFICKIQYPELCHILQNRDNVGHANPEVKMLAEEIKNTLKYYNPWLAYNVWNVCMQPSGLKAMKDLEVKKSECKYLAERNFKLQKELEESEESLDKLSALESYGVDNWEGYSIAMDSISTEEE